MMVSVIQLSVEFHGKFDLSLHTLCGDIPCRPCASGSGQTD
jgi:hypothetical protein